MFSNKSRVLISDESVDLLLHKLNNASIEADGKVNSNLMDGSAQGSEAGDVLVSATTADGNETGLLNVIPPLRFIGSDNQSYSMGLHIDGTTPSLTVVKDGGQAIVQVVSLLGPIVQYPTIVSDNPTVQFHTGSSQVSI
jgi:hypothetical protein